MLFFWCASFIGVIDSDFANEFFFNRISKIGAATTMRSIGAILICITALLTACGGESDPDQLGAGKLYDAYEVIDRGMTLQQVTAIVGENPQRSQPDGASQVLHTWEADQDNYRRSSLLISIDEDEGVKRKVITGYRGSESQTY